MLKDNHTLNVMLIAVYVTVLAIALTNILLFCHFFHLRVVLQSGYTFQKLPSVHHKKKYVYCNLKSMMASY